MSLNFYITDNDDSNIIDFYASAPCDDIFGDYTATNNSINIYNIIQSLGGCLGAYGQNSLSNQKFEEINEVILYPNPVKNILNVDLVNYLKKLLILYIVVQEK